MSSTYRPTSQPRRGSCSRYSVVDSRSVDVVECHCVVGGVVVVDGGHFRAEGS